VFFELPIAAMKNMMQKKPLQICLSDGIKKYNPLGRSALALTLFLGEIDLVLKDDLEKFR
jgi:hypothetical protein